MPKPAKTTVLEKDEAGEENERDAREKWIEQLHKAAPGVNWRMMDYETRLEKAKYYQNKNSAKSQIEIAGGALTGNWRETGSMNQAGRTHLVEYDYNTDSIYCASSGGNIWKADKSGNGWRCLNNYFKIPDINMVRIIDHNSGRRLLVSSGGWGVPSFYYSDDDGLSWAHSNGLNEISDWGCSQRTIVLNDADRTVIMLALQWDYDNWEKETSVYVSQDHGETFTKHHSFRESVYGSEGVFDIWTDNDGSGTAYFIENENISVFDGSFNLNPIGSITLSEPGSILLTGCETATKTYLYVGVYQSENIDFYQSQDAGISWMSMGNVASGPFFKTSFSCSQVYPETLYYGGMECYRSANGGDTWTKLNVWSDYYADILNKLHADIPSINSFVDDYGEEFAYVNTDGGTYLSLNSLETVQNISLTNHNVGQFYSVYSHRTDPSVIYGGTQDQGYQLCIANDGTGSESFEQIISGDYGHIVSSDGGNSIWMVYPGFAAYYPEAVTNPYFSDWWDFQCSGQFWIPPLMAHPDNPNQVYLGGGTTSSGTHMILLTSFSGWVTYEEDPYDFSGTSGATAISAMACSPLNDDYRYVMNGNGEFFASTDGGNTWTLTSGFDGPDGNYLNGAVIIPSPTTLGRVYVAGSGYSNPPVYVSNNNGTSFNSMSAGMPSTMVFEMAITPGEEFIFAATEVGPYVYVVSENYWYDLGQGVAPDQTYWTVDYSPATKIVRFATYGRGIWDFNIESGITGNKEKTIAGLTIYPNPATDYITVQGCNNQSLVIYDLKGRKRLEKDILGDRVKIDIENLETGIYIAKAGNLTQKIIVE